jgi:hypothetical protein
MTLILTAANNQNVVVVTDRRLTRLGKPFDDERTKLTVLTCNDGRVAIAYTGLAEATGLETETWLLDTLGSAATPLPTLASILQNVRSAATERFSTLTLPQNSKGLTIILAGYSYVEDPPRAYAWRISNFEAPQLGGAVLDQASDEFSIFELR